MNNQIGIAVGEQHLYQQTAAKAEELATLYSVAGHRQRVLGYQRRFEKDNGNAIGDF